MSKRLRIAVVCGSLTQAGGGRYAYELCRHIDKSRFEVDLLTIVPWGVGRQFYGPRIEESGVRIAPFLPLFHFRRLPPILRVAANSIQSAYRAWVLPKLMTKYELVAVLSLDHLLDIEFMLSSDQKIVLHLLNYNHQYSHNRYLEWPKSRSVFLVCMHRTQDQEATASMHAAIRGKLLVPLPIDVSQFKQISYERKSCLVIGCFKRIDNVDHFTAFLRAFARIVEHTISELRFYGGGNVSGLASVTSRLGLSEHVKYPGHAANIRETVLEDKVSIAWLPSFDDFLGYSGVELGLLGIPTLFFNVGNGKSAEEIRRLTRGGVHSHTSETELAEETLRIWQRPDLATQLVQELYNFVVREHDATANVKMIESFYERVIQSDLLKSVRPDR